MNASLLQVPARHVRDRGWRMGLFTGATNGARTNPLRWIWQSHDIAPIAIVNGHPDPRPNRFCAALCDAYAAGARESGMDVARLDIAAAQSDAALHLVHSTTRLIVVYPLWLDRPPESVRSFFAKVSSLPTAKQQMTSIVVTMDMPAFMHRSLLHRGDVPPHLVRAVDLPGVSHAETIFIGSVATMSTQKREEWLAAMHESGGRKRGRPNRFRGSVQKPAHRDQAAA